VTGLPDPGDVAVGGTGSRANVYVGDDDGVAQIGPSSSFNTSRVKGLPPGEWGTPGVAAGKLGIWVTDSSGPAVDRLGLDPKLGAMSVVERVPVRRAPNEASGFNVLSAIAVGKDAVWATGDTLEHALFRIDPATRRVTRLPLPSAPGPLAVGAGAVWVGGQLEDVVWRVDPRSGQVTDTIPVGGGVSDLAVGDGAVWATSSIDGTLVRIDPRTRKVVATISVGGGSAQGLAVGAGGVWVARDAS
jgi:streptogramin lyase